MEQVRLVMVCVFRVAREMFDNYCKKKKKNQQLLRSNIYQMRNRRVLEKILVIDGICPDVLILQLNIYFWSCILQKQAIRR